MTRRHEIMQQEEATRHQQLMELLMAHPTKHPTTHHPALGTQEGQQAAYNSLGISSTHLRTEEDRGKGISPIPARGGPHGGGPPGGGLNLPTGRAQYHIPFPKLEFPVFNGEETREWVDKCEQYFGIHQIPEEHWVDIASMHFTGKAY